MEKIESLNLIYFLVIILFFYFNKKNVRKVDIVLFYSFIFSTIVNFTYDFISERLSSFDRAFFNIGRGLLTCFVLYFACYYFFKKTNYKGKGEGIFRLFFFVIGVFVFIYATTKLIDIVNIDFPLFSLLLKAKQIKN